MAVVIAPTDCGGWDCADISSGALVAFAVFRSREEATLDDRMSICHRAGISLIADHRRFVSVAIGWKSSRYALGFKR